MSEYVPCPACGSSEVQKVNYTWWGGAVGPALLKLVKCKQCSKIYNGKTGKSVTWAIVLYMIAVIAIAIVIYLLLSQVL